MTPAQQGFRADNPTTAQIDDGLVVQFKLPALDRLGQFRRRPSIRPESAHSLSLNARNARDRDRRNRPVKPSAAMTQCSPRKAPASIGSSRSEEHTSELQSQSNLVCRLLLEKKNNSQK